MSGDRWATFDCYGTLVDWRAGIRAELERLFGEGEGERMLERYHEIEPRIQREQPQERYRAVMATVLAELATEAGAEEAPEDADALGRVAWRLHELAERFGEGTPEGIEVELPLSQEQLASWCGASREATVKALAALRTLGCVSTGRRSVVIHDAEALRRHADGAV